MSHILYFDQRIDAANLDWPWLSDTSNNKLGKNLKFIIDVTIGYPNGEPLNLSDVIFGDRKPFQTTFHYRCYPVSDVPRAEDALLKWLYDRYVEKEDLLEVFYRTGKFPEVQNSCGVETGTRLESPRLLTFSPLRCIVIQAYLFISSGLAVYLVWQICATVYALI